MDELLQQLLNIGVNYIKSDSGISLEILEYKPHQAAEIDLLINKLLDQLQAYDLNTVRLECPAVFFNHLAYTKGKMQIVGERVLYKSSFIAPLDVSEQDYALWSIFDSSSIAFLAAVMGKSFQDAEKFLMEMNAELPSQAQKMYTVYIVNQEPIGVVFPHIEPNTKQEGRLFWIGVHPNYLGQGLGKKLHAIGLYRLKNELKANSYMGITQIDNHPMRKIMVANGCIQYKYTLMSLCYSIKNRRSCRQ
ncbi:GNAT family N-acetyltransferase [Lysinibacillus louembei]|uniref:GNAT family N-acetyltransferase n=1 Tax=Lysinibacillus louembei TaxID=1470088 RepID=A0ABZ0RZH8_9BACI|nr:GNAT family N-acetyltransferase [Lysinibacillus louembei]WPK12701.1 GNAT family N-acetyltransferase [Lysinibacillus louembei]